MKSTGSRARPESLVWDNEVPDAEAQDDDDDDEDDDDEPRAGEGEDAVGDYGVDAREPCARSRGPLGPLLA